MSKVSILVITFNRANYLSQAIDSVVVQSFRDWELIVVDDCSSDNTKETVKKYLKLGLPIKYVRNDKNLGIVKSRNLALSLCTGECIAVLDSDDIWREKNKLQKQVEFMDNNPEYVLCGSMAKIIDKDDKEIGEIVYAKKDEEIRKFFLLSNQFVHSSVVYRKSVADAVGGYDEYGVGEDYDLFLKIGLKGKIANLSEFLVNYRKHLTGATWKNRVFSAKEHLKIIKKYKDKYPNYHIALLKSYFRIVLAFLKLV